MPLWLICQSFPVNLPDKKRYRDYSMENAIDFYFRFAIHKKKKKMNGKAQRTSEFFDASQRVIRLYFHGIQFLFN